MKRFLFLITLMLSGCSKYNVGDCFQFSNEDHTYRVKKIGKYSLIAEKAVYANRIEDVIMNKDDIKKSIQTDCFDSFDPKDPEKQ